MAIPFFQADEATRLEALASLEVLETPAEQLFDDFTLLAGQICECPISLISLVDDQRLWFKSKLGFDLDETPRTIAFCAHAIASPSKVLVVKNAAEDQRFADNTLVTGEQHIRFYAGAPLVTPKGYAMGTLCVMDRQPRTLSAKQIESLKILARQVMAQFEARKNLRRLQQTTTDLEDLRREIQLILDHVPAYVYIKDTKNTILRVNRAVAELLGLEISSIEGRSAEELYPANAEAFYRLDLEVIRSGHSSLRNIQQVDTGNAGLRWSSTDVVPISNTEGQVERLLILANDITDLKNTEDSLRESQAQLSLANERLEQKVQKQIAELRDSQARYEDLYQNAPDMFISVDPKNGCIMQCNETLLTELGYAREEVVGQVITKLIHPSSLGEEQAITNQFRDKGFIRDRELSLARKNGTPLVVSLNVSAIRDPRGKIISSRGVFRDITELKQLEDEAKSHRDQLAHLSRVATINAMASGIAHELNQPLHAIKNYAQGALIRLGQQSFDPASLAPIFKDIVTDADRAAELILSLRRYVKPSDRQSILIEPTELIDRVAKLLVSEIEHKNSTLVLDADDPLPLVSCDAVQIEQVLINLILNAAEAVSESDAKNREIEVIVKAAEQQTVRFSIVDQGVGADDLARMFDTFYTTKASGLGMGLPICRTIIEAHGGTLTATANDGPGLTLSFELPTAGS